MILKEVNQDKYFQRALMLLLCGNILLFFLGDIVNRISMVLELGFLRFTGISKALGLMANIFFILKFRLYQKAYAKPMLWAIFILLGSFITGNIFLENTNLILNIGSNFIYFLYACFLPIFLIPFFSINKKTNEKALGILLIIFWVNIIFIFIGYIYDIQSFKTYFYGGRFGFKGLIDHSDYVSYLFIFVVIYYYYNWQVYGKHRDIIYFWIALSCSLLIGTKRIYFFLILFAMFHFIFKKLYLKKWFYVFAFTVFSIFMIFKDNIVSLLSKKFGLLLEIHQKNGLITALTSFRNNLLMDYMDSIIRVNWTPMNFIFGGGIFHEIRPEMDFIDSYLFFGIFGPLVYIFIFRKYLFNYKIKSPIVYFFLFLIIILCFFSSGVIFSADFAILIILFSSFFYFENQKPETFEK